MEINWTLEDFWYELSVWSQKTFGSDKVRGSTGPLKHLAKEINEVLAKPDDLEEYADLLFLVFDATRRAGFTYKLLVEAARDKLEINKKRKWPTPTSDEPVEHVKEQ